MLCILCEFFSIYIYTIFQYINFKLELLDSVRPEFHGFTVQSCVDGRETLRFSGWQRFCHAFLSVAASAGILLLSLLCSTGIFYGRFALNDKVSDVGKVPLSTST